MDAATHGGRSLKKCKRPFKPGGHGEKGRTLPRGTDDTMVSRYHRTKANAAKLSGYRNTRRTLPHRAIATTLGGCPYACGHRHARVDAAASEEHCHAKANATALGGYHAVVFARDSHNKNIVLPGVHSCRFGARPGTDLTGDSTNRHSGPSHSSIILPIRHYEWPRTTGCCSNREHGQLYSRDHHCAPFV